MKLPRYKYLLSVFDFFSLFLMLLILTNYILLKDNDNLFSFFYNNIEILFIYLLVAFIFIFIIQSNNLYKINFFLVSSHHLTYLIKSLIYTWIIFILISFLLKKQILIDSRMFVFYGFIFSFLYFFIVRVLFFEKIILKNFGNTILKRRVLIYGAGKNGKLLSTKFAFENPFGIEIIGFIDDDKNLIGKIINGYKVLCDFNGLKEVISNNKIDEIIISIENSNYDSIINIIEECKKFGILLKIASNLFEVIPNKMIIEKIQDIPFINVSPNIKSNFFFIIKRFVDLSGSFIGILLLSPFLIIIGIIIKLTSPGPIIIKQKRIGKNGKPFNFYKFRSMRVVNDSEEEKRKKDMIDFIKDKKNDLNGETKIIDITRLTKIGKFIRKTSLDELPQLFNVIKGDMSLVGPRPCLPYEYENLEDWQKKRFEVLPGCTGVWQVFGRSRVNYKESVIMDLYYINNISPWLDLQLIIKTFPVMVFGKGGK